MVSGGMGVTLLPKIAAEGGVAAGVHVAVRPFAEPLVGRSIGVAWREGGQREQEALMLAELLRKDLFAGV
jgi:LysR family hydrogen peroxide-inducible transcriptional activator